MTTTLCRAGRIRRLLCSTLAAAIAAATSATAFAQTNAAAMAVRQRVEGLSPEGAQPQSPPGAPAPGAAPGQSAPAEMTSGKIDTRYIASGSAAVIVVRPAQILASPILQIFPVEVASAAAVKNLGFDAAEIEEIDGFFDPSSFGYGATFKFKNAIRASSIPPEQRAHAQLAELGGKKYLRSTIPTKWSLYGPNNKTLIAATDPVLHQLVENASQPKSGPMFDRLREVPSGSDLFVAVDVAALRPLLAPFIQMGLAQAQSMGNSSEAKQNVEMFNLTSGLELTLNVSAPGLTSLVVHYSDDAAAQKAEAMAQENLQKLRASTQSGQPGGDNPIPQAMERYKDRLSQLFQPQRSGSTVTFIHVDGQNPAQQQLVAAAIIGGAGAAISPAIKAWGAAAMRAQAAPGPGVGPEGGVPPGTPGAPGAGP
jgi:hypothetical protein